MQDVKLYREWEPILEAEQDCIVCDPDATLMVFADGKDETPMTKEEALNYFWNSTLKFGPTWIERFKKEMAERAEQFLR